MSNLIADIHTVNRIENVIRSFDGMEEIPVLMAISYAVNELGRDTVRDQRLAGLKQQAGRIFSAPDPTPFFLRELYNAKANPEILLALRIAQTEVARKVTSSHDGWRIMAGWKDADTVALVLRRQDLDEKDRHAVTREAMFNKIISRFPAMTPARVAKIATPQVQ